MKAIKLNVFITEGSRHNSDTVMKLIEHSERIFRSNGFNISLPTKSTTYVKKTMDNGLSIFDFSSKNSVPSASKMDNNTHLISVEKGEELSIFSRDKEINVVFVKSLHNKSLNSWSSSLAFDHTNTVCISEECCFSSLAHSLMNHYGVNDQFSNPNCLSYGSDYLRLDTLMSEDEKLILSEELLDAVV